MTKSDSTLQTLARDLALYNMLDVRDDETHIAALERAGLIMGVRDYAGALEGWSLTSEGKYAQRELESVQTRSRVSSACNTARAQARSMGVRIPPLVQLTKQDAREAFNALEFDSTLDWTHVVHGASMR